MNSEYTKGEWRVEVYDTFTNVESDIQTICTDVSNEDAHLISAAPDMYEALKELETHIKQCYFRTDKARILMEKALAKAEGKND